MCWPKTLFYLIEHQSLLAVGTEGPMRLLFKGITFVVACFSFVLLASLPIKSQSQFGATGTVLGHIQDSSGGAIPGAKVTLRNTQTGISRTFTTSNVGDYVFVNEIPGTYVVTVEKSGFITATTGGLILHVGQTLRQDFTLQVGSETQRVTISAQAPMLQTDNAAIGSVVNSRTIAALPLNGRDYTTLIAINAGVTQPSGGIQASIFDPHGLNPSWSMSSIDGARPASISYLVDGITDSDQFFAKSISLISADSIQEFKLQNGLYSAAYGAGSAQVNVAIKSGTNQLHGTAYDYWRNSALQPDNAIIAALNARNGSHTPVVSPFNQNQFGFTLGATARSGLWATKGDARFPAASHRDLPSFLQPKSATAIFQIGPIQSIIPRQQAPFRPLRIIPPGVFHFPTTRSLPL